MKAEPNPVAGPGRATMPGSRTEMAEISPRLTWSARAISTMRLCAP